MKETIRNIIERRSIRSFLSEQIRNEELNQILECGLHAPTGGNKQENRFLVLQNPSEIDELNRILCENLAARDETKSPHMKIGIVAARNEKNHFFYHAPTVITAVAPKKEKNAMADCAISLSYMQLAAHSLGLGSCWANQPFWLTDVPEIRQYFMGLGMKEEDDIYGTISVGYIRKSRSGEKEIKPNRVIIHR